MPCASCHPGTEHQWPLIPPSPRCVSAWRPAYTHVRPLVSFLGWSMDVASSILTYVPAISDLSLDCSSICAISSSYLRCSSFFSSCISKVPYVSSWGHRHELLSTFSQRPLVPTCSIWFCASRLSWSCVHTTQTQRFFAFPASYGEASPPSPC